MNAAYEAGILIVAAAGNNYRGFPLSDIVWPARFGRVIAACGVMADGRPYANLPLEEMAGNHGPPSKMRTALADYTPNVPWLRVDCPQVVSETGSGTSSATPQIAVAAALWLRKYNSVVEKYPQPWMRVEALRQALFRSAKPQSAPIDPFFGEGIIDAVALLNEQPAEANELSKQPPDSGPFDFLGLAGLGIDGDQRDLALLQLELTQLAATSCAVREIVPDPGVRRDYVTQADRLRVFQAVLDDGKASQALRRYLENQVRRFSTWSVDRGAAGSPPASPDTPASSPEVLRQTRRRPPEKRRLRIFASDPGLGTKLATGGSGVLPPADLHPDLVKRVAEEAAKVARQVLNICIRALDYCPPHDVTFADCLKALTTADFDLVGDDRYGYRTAFLEAFRARHLSARRTNGLGGEPTLGGRRLPSRPDWVTSSRR